MIKHIKKASLAVFLSGIWILLSLDGLAQSVPITAYSVNANGQAVLTVNSNTSQYFILKVRHQPSGSFELITSMALGQAGTTEIVEPLGAFPLLHYEVEGYPVSAPGDVDGDGIDDMTEWNGMPFHGPLNAVPSLDLIDGAAAINSLQVFNSLSVTQNVVQWSEFLNGKKFVKYAITDFNSDRPHVYFINSETHNLHADFATALGLDFLSEEVKKGQIIYHPNVVASNGTLGTFAFNYSNGHGQDFETVQRTHELLAANMPFVQNNLSYFITENNSDEYVLDSDLYESSRIPVLFEADVYAELDYWGLNPGEGYGILRLMEHSAIPGPRDIVVYESLPNALPRVGGIISGSIQTPLSHVNLRAIQDKVPNAFIRDPLEVPDIAALLDQYVYYKAEQGGYTIRASSQQEVDAWFDQIRPTQPQSPPLNLDQRAILPLSEIFFDMADAFGAKATNVATMHRFGFPAGTIPDGYAVPFYFYYEFMRHSGLMDRAREMIRQPEFMANRTERNLKLEEFRASIRVAQMPNWMLIALSEMHAGFPEGTSVRCRSSSNNEDLPGFSGAGLYDSKTHRLDEGHISKTIKQVFASLWNLRAFEERDFYRVDHFTTCMGVLCHPNFSDEKVNGVGVSVDPVFNTQNTFYLNAQLGEDLITNPDGLSLPEELLVDWQGGSADDFTVVQRSSLIDADTLLMGGSYLAEMKHFLGTIHREFELLYGATENPTFAIDIEFKITFDDRLVVKQARPWVFYEADLKDAFLAVGSDDLHIFPNPASDFIRVGCPSCKLSTLRIFDISGRLMGTAVVDFTGNAFPRIPIEPLPAGVYILTASDEGGVNRYAGRFMKQ